MTLVLFKPQQLLKRYYSDINNGLVLNREN